MSQPTRKSRCQWLVGIVAAALLIGGGYHAFIRPSYAWLNFGPEVKIQLLVCDRGWWKTVTQYVNGKPAGSAQQLREWKEWKELTLRDADGETTYTVQRLDGYAEPGKPKGLMADVRVNGPLTYDQYCDVRLVATDPGQADVAHFHGPLVIAPQTSYWKLPAELAFLRGGPPTRIPANVGTIDETRGTWTVVRSHDENRKPKLPKGIHPEVEICFPPPSSGSEPIVERYPLDQVCCGPLFYGMIPVPAGIGKGMAKITYSFPAWHEANIASTTVEIPVVDDLSELPNAAAKAGK